MTRTQKFILAGIIVLAIFFRFNLLGSMPGGLFPDEAANGLDVDLMYQGQIDPFYERGNGREALFFYMLWGGVQVLGKSPLTHHAVSALVGVLSVILCFAVTRRLFSPDLSFPRKRASANTEMNPWVEPEDGNKKNRAIYLAFLSSFLMAVSSWHTVLSRTAFRANLIPLFATLTFYLLLVAYQSQTFKKRLLFSFLTGASFALGFYTYIAYRILVPILAVLILWPLIGKLKEKQLWKTVSSYKLLVISFLIGFAIFFYPLGKYFIDHPGSFVGRSGQVSVFNEELNGGDLIGTTLEVTRLSLKAYFIDGDLNWRHNVSGLAFLPPFVSPFFGASLMVITFLAAWYLLAPSKRSMWWKYAVLAGWFWGMLLPVITTAEGIPHGLRAIGTIPPVFIISALGLYKFGEFVMYLHRRLWQKYSMRSVGQHVAEFGFKVLVACFAVASIFYSYFWYFSYAYNSPDNFYSFRSDLSVVSDYLIERCNKQNTYLILDKFSVQTPDYLTNVDPRNPINPCNKPYVQVDPENSWELKGLTSQDEIIFTQSSLFDTKKFMAYHPEAYLLQEVRNKFRQTVMAIYKIRN
ncbi:MAG: hypothetical protein COT92_02180 [Candidatus Doudnabacteria bacterium CG10_big_fil_rev_8_21_14_0_10_42_18]|uniref:Glycosyltransferase RgtA/B/C/D-like domain-containing protein n=1 Tax=Candidatus Doudnabacteria bacterium CG10_big_fil_rev_8_21_14_0_10_42_18 TaxID=1974552 RepID=A0A2H0VAY1_9BACT|nr:MAG: hypothetical protein COT92_02180 [Candidatus Doudnabacteria bacterium CG10_big_fil_rev_8_21_14_0_10_42_18]